LLGVRRGFEDADADVPAAPFKVNFLTDRYTQ
jgi:hypothetical protein